MDYHELWQDNSSCHQICNVDIERFFKYNVYWTSCGHVTSVSDNMAMGLGRHEPRAVAVDQYYILFVCGDFILLTASLRGILFSLNSVVLTYIELVDFIKIFSRVWNIKELLVAQAGLCRVFIKRKSTLQAIRLQWGFRPSWISSVCIGPQGERRGVQSARHPQLRSSPFAVDTIESTYQTPLGTRNSLLTRFGLSSISSYLATANEVLDISPIKNIYAIICVANERRLVVWNIIKMHAKSYFPVCGELRIFVLKVASSLMLL